MENLNDEKIRENLMNLINFKMSDIKLNRIGKYLSSQTPNSKSNLILEEILDSIKTKSQQINEKAKEREKLLREPKADISENFAYKIFGERIKNLPYFQKTLSNYNFAEFKTHNNSWDYNTRFIDNVFRKKLKIDDLKYTFSKDNDLSTKQKKSKIFLNIENFSQKKDLKYEKEEFKRIILPQKVKPPNLDLDFSNVVNNSGIYPLKSLRKIYKNDELHYYENLPTPDMIEFDNFEKYMKPSEDPNLKKMMKSGNFKFSSSTSGISSTLSHFFYKLTNFKSPHFYNLSDSFKEEPLKFMMYQRKPSMIVLNKNENGQYSINKNSIFESKNEIILLKMGKYMEKLFTCSKEVFEKRYIKKDGKKPESYIDEGDYFNFVGYDKILLRSQIDCAGKDKFGNDIVFEIKTRAVSPIRYDVYNYFDYLNYELNSLLGKHSSYEREFYDLIRGAFLKYLFQLKIGGMDGAFISYHNTQKIYGFEYISLNDIERRIFGNCNFSNIIFKASLKMLEETLEYILKDFPNEEKLYIGLFANEWKGTLDFFVELVNEDSYNDLDKYPNLQEVIDYYYISNRNLNVHKYSLVATPILNSVVTTFTPILFENSDSYNVKYLIQYQGRPSKDEYMKFIHEGFMSKSINLENQYTGSWSLAYEK